MSIRSIFHDIRGNPISERNVPEHDLCFEYQFDNATERKVAEVQYKQSKITARIEIVYSTDDFEARRAAHPDIDLRHVYFKGPFRIEDDLSYRNSVRIDRCRALLQAEELICIEYLPGDTEVPEYSKTKKYLYIGDTPYYQFEYDAKGECCYIRHDDYQDDLYPTRYDRDRHAFDWSGLSYYRFATPFLPEDTESFIFSTWQNFLTRSSS